jgi:hypothetical protein
VRGRKEEVDIFVRTAENATESLPHLTFDRKDLKKPELSAHTAKVNNNSSPPPTRTHLKFSLSIERIELTFLGLSCFSGLLHRSVMLGFCVQRESILHVREVDDALRLISAIVDAIMAFCEEHELSDIVEFLLRL